MRRIVDEDTHAAIRGKRIGAGRHGSERRSAADGRVSEPEHVNDAGGMSAQSRRCATA